MADGVEGSLAAGVSTLLAARFAVLSGFSEQAKSKNKLAHKIKAGLCYQTEVEEEGMCMVAALKWRDRWVLRPY